VLAFNRVVDAATAEEVAKLFAECIAAPGFADRAKEIFAAKKNLRLLELPAGGLEPERELQLKRILGECWCSSRISAKSRIVSCAR